MWLTIFCIYIDILLSLAEIMILARSKRNCKNYEQLSAHQRRQKLQPRSEACWLKSLFGTSNLAVATFSSLWRSCHTQHTPQLDKDNLMTDATESEVFFLTKTSGYFFCLNCQGNHLFERENFASIFWESNSDLRQRKVHSSSGLLFKRKFLSLCLVCSAQMKME